MEILTTMNNLCIHKQGQFLHLSNSRNKRLPSLIHILISEVLKDQKDMHLINDKLKKRFHGTVIFLNITRGGTLQRVHYLTIKRILIINKKMINT